MAHAQLVVGESATMSSEAAVLGVPAVFIATTGRGYTDDEERRYGLVRHFTEDQYDEAVATVEELLADDPPGVRGTSPRAAARREDRRHRAGWSTTSSPASGRRPDVRDGGLSA